MPVAVFVDAKGLHSPALIAVAEAEGFVVRLAEPSNVLAQQGPTPAVFFCRLNLPGPLSAYDVGRRIRASRHCDGALLVLHGTGEQGGAFPAFHPPFDYVLPSNSAEVTNFFRRLRDLI